MAAKALRAVPSGPFSIETPLVGWICGYDSDRGLLVDFSRNVMGTAIPARWTVQLDKATVEQAIQDQQKVVLIFEDGDPARPIVAGLVQPIRLREPAPPVEVGLVGKPTEARLDGKRLTLEAEDEIVLRCGPASLTLRRNGALQLKGAYIVSHSTGVNRIRGGSVAIN